MAVYVKGMAKNSNRIEFKGSRVLSQKKTVRSQKKWVWSQKKINFKVKLLKKNFLQTYTVFLRLLN